MLSRSSLRFAPDARGVFFPRFPRLGIALRVTRVWGELSPAVAMQHSIEPGQAHGAAQLRLNIGLKTRDDDDTAYAGRIQYRIECGALLRQISVGSVANR